MFASQRICYLIMSIGLLLKERNCIAISKVVCYYLYCYSGSSIVSPIQVSMMTLLAIIDSKTCSKRRLIGAVQGRLNISERSCMSCSQNVLFITLNDRYAIITVLCTARHAEPLELAYSGRKGGPEVSEVIINNNEDDNINNNNKNHLIIKMMKERMRII